MTRKPFLDKDEDKSIVLETPIDYLCYATGTADFERYGRIKLACFVQSMVTRLLKVAPPKYASKLGKLLRSEYLCRILDTGREDGLFEMVVKTEKFKQEDINKAFTFMSYAVINSQTDQGDDKGLCQRHDEVLSDLNVTELDMARDIITAAKCIRMTRKQLRDRALAHDDNAPAKPKAKYH